MNPSDFASRSTCSPRDDVRARGMRRAFTMVEMLVVIAIITVLLAAGAGVMNSGTQSSSVRISGDHLRALVNQARAAAVGQGTEARLLIANDESDDERYLRMAMVVVAKIDPAQPDTWNWEIVSEPTTFPGGVAYMSPSVFDATKVYNQSASDWGQTGGGAAGAVPIFGQALKDYTSAGSWISLAFDGNGRLISDTPMTENPLLVVNLARGAADGLFVPEKFVKYAEGVMVVRSNGQPVPLEFAYEQAKLGGGEPE